MYHLTAENFDREALRADGSAVVMFYEKWCPKCSMTRPVVEETEKKYAGKIRFFETEISEAPGLAERYGADVVPAFLFVKNGTVKGFMKGVPGEKILEKRIEELL